MSFRGGNKSRGGGRGGRGGNSRGGFNNSRLGGSSDYNDNANNDYYNNNNNNYGNNSSNYGNNNNNNNNYGNNNNSNNNYRNNNSYANNQEYGTNSVSFDNAGPCEVWVEGFPTGDTDISRFIQFLLKKTEKPVTVTNVSDNGSHLVVSAQNPFQATTLTKLSGVRFRGCSISVKPHSSNNQGYNSHGNNSPNNNFNRPGSASMTSSGSQIGQTISTLRTMVQSRYMDGNFLNMEDLANDQLVRQQNIKIFDNKFGPVLCKIIGELFPNVGTISFANNKLRDLNIVATLPQWVSGVTALSFQNNNIHSLRDIEVLPGKDFTNLKEIVFLDNPIRDKEMSRPGGDIKYKTDIKKIFPSIQMLDMEPAFEDISFAIDPTDASFPVQPLGGFIEPSVTDLVNGFISNFYSCFDNNRMDLLHVYHEQAVFSLSVDSSGAAGSGNAGGRNRYNNNADNKNMDVWWTFNRDHVKISDVSKRLQSIKVGSRDIITLFQILPVTKHPLDDVSKFRLDSYQTGGEQSTLLVVIHGEFFEEQARCRRSFDRTFVIIPSQPGSMAANANIPFCIINDQFTIRYHRNLPKI